MASALAGASRPHLHQQAELAGVLQGVGIARGGAQVHGGRGHCGPLGKGMVRWREGRPT